MATIHVMTATDGDRVITYDRTRAEEVEAAQRQFEALVTAGYLAFATEAPAPGRIKEFDLDAERIVISPWGVGG